MSNCETADTTGQAKFCQTVDNLKFWGKKTEQVPCKKIKQNNTYPL